MTVVFSRPYEFQPPDYGTVWPWIIQRFRLYEGYLKNMEGIVSSDCRGLEYFRESIDRGDGILLAPNHCRYGDPVVLGWPAKLANVNVFAMASWHLFNEGAFNAFAIRKMGAFSIYREGTDRQSLETAINILATAARPLVVFPEGTTSRMNDYVMPLLEGVTFIARAAARRRAKKSGGRVVVMPVGIKYLCEADVEPWAKTQLDALESMIGWQPKTEQPILGRCIGMFEALLTLKELEHLGHCQTGKLPQRRDDLIEKLLAKAQSRLGIKVLDDSPPGERIRQIRTEAATRFFDGETSESEKLLLRRDVATVEVALQLTLVYPEQYWQPNSVTDTRIVEIIQRLQECFGRTADVSMPLKSVMQFDEPIEVPAAKAPRGQEDPILASLRDRLCSMVETLSAEARPLAAK